MPPSASAFAELPAALAAAGFRGDILTGAAERAAFATDNSIYQVSPDLVVAPKDADDVVCLMRVMAQPGFAGVPVTARGGGTGTNGQSLNRGVIVNFQKYMNRVLALNVAEGWADVEPGVVPQELNAALAKHDLMFAATTSTATRCTIGGMVATDASGKGSRCYGKTSDNVLALDLALSDGTVISSQSTLPAEVAATMARVAEVVRRARPGLMARIPHLSRRFTGYDFERAVDTGGELDWVRLVVGAEGTLGLVTRVRIRLVRRPACTGLLVIAFATVLEALDAGVPLLAHEPTAIEIMDDMVFRMAEEAGLLTTLPPQLRGTGAAPALCYLEIHGDTREQVERSLAAAQDTARGLPGFVGSYLCRDRHETEALWSVRSGSVGLVARSEGRRSPVAFVEDCVVPLSALSAFTREFTELLRRRGLHFGMYGHVDVGCIHIRPALDLSDAGDRAMIMEISDAVFELTLRHGGIFWGEHGKGIRGAYLERFVGADAYRAFLDVRLAFDPWLRMNPGKLVDRPERRWSISRTPLRVVAAPAGAPAPDAFRCNGNAECLSVAQGQAMCPSFRATRDLRFSPKGRADALREWQLALVSDPVAAGAMEPDLLKNLDLCLACKACSSNCKARVDVPEMRSQFLAVYHRQQPYSAEATAFMTLEAAAPVLARMRRLSAPLARLATPLVQRALKLRDLPDLDGRGPSEQILSVTDLEQRKWPERSVMVLPDPFTLLFDTEALTDICAGLRRLGYRPVIARLPPGGKAAHNFGDRQRFARRATKLDAALKRLARLRVPMLAADPAFLAGLMHDHARLGLPTHGVLSVQAFLAGEAMDAVPWPRLSGELRILTHCGEALPGDPVRQQWKTVGIRLGIPIEVSRGSCCGMAGHFGHQERHAAMSREIYDTNWRARVEAGEPATAYVSGFSCRCQVRRMSGIEARHPLAAIARLPLHAETGE